MSMSVSECVRRKKELKEKILQHEPVEVFKPAEVARLTACGWRMVNIWGEG